MGDVHVVFGSTGALGAAIVRRLCADGVPVRAIVRNASKAQRVLPDTAQVIAADARSQEGVGLACRDASVIYHCVNVPYNMWYEVLPAVTDNISSGARQANARLVFAGNVYGYGRFQNIPATEDHPRDATAKKGKLRNELEEKLMAAHRAGEVPVVIPRMPDFYGPNVTNKLYGAIFEAALAGKRAMWVGNADVPHDLLYIGDAAAACVLLGGTESAYGETWHVPGAGPLTGRQFLEMIFRTAGEKPKFIVAGRAMLWLSGLFDPVSREVTELMYLFEEPQVLDGTKLHRAFPSFQFTPHEEAVHRTLEGFRRAKASAAAR